MEKPVIISADIRHKQAAAYYEREMNHAIEEINREINNKSHNGKYSVKIDIDEIMARFDVNLETLCYIYNCFLKAGFEIVDENTEWIIKW